ncbi:hypothetical protein NGH39_13220, partial [Staphylococcus pasteuri]
IRIDHGAAKPPPLPPGSKKDEEQEKKKGPRADQDDKSPDSSGKTGKTGKSWPGAPRASASGAAPRSSIVAPRSGEPHPKTKFVPRPTPRVFDGMDTAEILAVTVERLLNEGGKALASIEKMKALAATIKAIDAGDNAAAATAIAT